jgi:UDP-N-acetylmuramate dehydrogenase
MNAGAYGGEMKDVLISVTHTDTNGNIVTMQADELDLGYRKSFYSDNTDKIILSAEFRLTVGDKTEIKAKMDDLMGRRKDKQPLEFPSAGSTFKRPEGHFAGALIEQCNLKGYTIGGAQVSEKHAGFIINRFNGTATDVLDLIDYVRNTVQNETGITLEPEVRIIP